VYERDPAQARRCRAEQQIQQDLTRVEDTSLEANVLMFKKKSPLKATRLHQRKRRARIIKISFAVFALMLFIGCLSWLSRIHVLAIDSVQVIGNAGIDTEDLKNIADKHLAGSYIALFSKSNKLLYPKETIETDIRNTFPSIHNLNIETQGHELAITLSERKPAYVWCKGDFNDHTNNGCYFLDEHGYIFSDAPTFSGDVYFVFYGGITSENPIGTTLLSFENLKDITDFVSQLEQKGIPVSALSLRDDGVREAHFVKHGKVIFKDSQNPLDVAASLELLKIKTDLFSAQATGTIDYIDFRFGNKVYYKFIGDNPVQSTE
jgi:cell division septal protein FtsQ